MLEQCEIVSCVRLDLTGGFELSACPCWATVRGWLLVPVMDAFAHLISVRKLPVLSRSKRVLGEFLADIVLDVQILGVLPVLLMLSLLILESLLVLLLSLLLGLLFICLLQKRLFGPQSHTTHSVDHRSVY